MRNPFLSFYRPFYKGCGGVVDVYSMHGPRYPAPAPFPAPFPAPAPAPAPALGFSP